MTLRDYQQTCLEKIVKGFDEFDRQLLVLPTGGGKTIVFSWLAKMFLPRRTLILCHREELIDQAIAKLHASTGIVAGKEKAEFEASRRDDVVVASVQTMIRRFDKWPSDHFGLVVADEAHHAVSDSWASVLNHFTSAKILGVTATPDRGDKKNLGKYFQNVAHEVALSDLINQKFLCPITIKSVPLEINLSGIKQTAGDYDANGLDSALAPYFGSIADAVKVHAADRKTLVFLPLIATSKAFTDCCVQRGLKAEHVDGYSDDRRDKLDRFARREFDVLCNAMLLTEGYDDPTIDCVIVLRPTRSRSLFSQMVGRGTRIANGKDNLLLLDFLWLHEKHSLIRPAHLIASTNEEAEAITEMAEQKGESQDALDLQGLASECQAQREKALREELARKAKKKSKSIDAMAFFLSVHQPNLADYEPEMQWESEPVSPKQSEVLAQIGIDVESVSCKGHASKILNTLFERRAMNLATPAQVKWLAHFKHPSPHTANFVEAGVFLDKWFGKRSS